MENDPILDRDVGETWVSASYQGLPVIRALAEHDMSTVFSFLSARGWSRAAMAAATGLSESRVRSLARGRQRVTSYEVLERIAEGLGIDRGLMGLSYVVGDAGRSAAVPMPPGRGPWWSDAGVTPGGRPIGLRIVRADTPTERGPTQLSGESTHADQVDRLT